MSRTPVLIVGAGIAGAATAYFLAQRGVRGIVILERAASAATHSTGRNAAILRTAAPQAAVHALAADSMRFYLKPPEGFSEVPLVQSVGLYLAAPQHATQGLENWVTAQGNSLDARRADPAELYAIYPQLARDLGAAWHFEREGVLDVEAIVQGFLRGARQAGAEVRFGCEARELLFEGDRVVGVASEQGDVLARQTVLASGAWADHLPQRAGRQASLQVRRRHLMSTPPLPELADQGPVVWIEGDDFYFRPESGGLLLCACDQDVVHADDSECLREEVLDEFAQKCARWLPGFPELQAARIWAGARTFAADEHFSVGPDPEWQGLHWVAGLAGHGISCGAAVGRLAAEWIAESWSAVPVAHLHAPRLSKLAKH